MRYSENLIEEIRERNDIVEIISGYVQLKKKGSTYFGLCPFHNEKSPSFSVTPGKQMYYCFGCGAGGNVYTFLMEYENFTFKEAVEYLAQRCGMELPKEEDSEETKKEADLKTSLLKLQKEAALFYYYQLKSKQGVLGMEYLRKRCLTDETIIRFGLGYSGKTGRELSFYLKKKGYSDELLKESGLITIEERGMHDKFWNRVMFPIMDVRNRVIGFGGRVMGEGEPKYLNSPETKIFDKSRNLYGMNLAKNSRRPNLIICEGYMDVISLHQAGFENAVASLGTAFTSGQASLMKRYTKEVLLSYDSDQAGIKAVLRAIPILKEAGLSARVITMKPYKDPDEFIKNLGAEAFEERILQAKNSFLFEIEILKRDYNMENPEQKTRFYQETAKKLLNFSEELERKSYLEAVCKEHSIDYEGLNNMVKHFAYQMDGRPALLVRQSQEAEKEVGSRTEKKKKEGGMKESQRLLLTWLIEDTRLFSRLEGIISPRDFTDEFYHLVAEILYQQYQENGTVNPARIVSHFTEEEKQREAARLFQTSLKTPMNEKQKETAVNETVYKIKQNWCEYAGSHASDFAELEEIKKVKRSLQDLHISLA